MGGDPLTDAPAGGLSSVSGEGITTLVSQVIAVPLVMGTLVISITFRLASVTAAFIGSGAMWVPLWLRLYWTVRWSTPSWVFWWTIGIAVVSLGFASGGFPHLLHSWSVDSAPASSAMP